MNATKKSIGISYLTIKWNMDLGNQVSVGLEISEILNSTTCFNYRFLYGFCPKVTYRDKARRNINRISYF